ncbi:MAG: UDP-glucose/GDP-mannose dehydrogenase family protein [Candidatus Aenigmarchaeota archaeon]|nr:UDP-glucose/GDP-mannose dehydrogenase family protein [Candidatus Aenigmarchaeota archaeon]
MKIVVIGAGYVGITLSCLTEFGHEVTMLGRDKEKAARIARGVSPIYEPGLEEVLRAGIKKGLLKSTTDYSVVKDADVIFICVGTPSRDDGSIDLSQVETCSKSIGEQMRESGGYKVVVVKSTCLPGTTTDVVIPTVEKASGKKAGEDFGACMNPEFLREGSGVYDFMNPDKIVIGGIDSASQKVLSDLYSGFDQKFPRIFTDTNTAEMIKYGNNAMLATRISFMNELANICEHYHADVKEVSRAMGIDSRIGPKFLNAGAGFGGSCFPKDVKALISAAKKAGVKPSLLEEVMKINDSQPERMVDLAEKTIGDLTDKKVSILGLAFKSDTDDMRDSRSTVVIQSLLRKHAKVRAYDPKAMENARGMFDNMVTFCASKEECVKDADLVMVMTEWDEFKNMELSSINAPIIDGRRIIDPEKVAQRGLVYRGIGWKDNFRGGRP